MAANLKELFAKTQNIGDVARTRAAENSIP